jgi:hypothetical protein
MNKQKQNRRIKWRVGVWNGHQIRCFETTVLKCHTLPNYFAESDDVNDEAPQTQTDQPQKGLQSQVRVNGMKTAMVVKMWLSYYILFILLFCLPGFVHGNSAATKLFNAFNSKSKSNSKINATRSSVSVSVSEETDFIDIGIVAACVRKRFRRFVDRINFKTKTKWVKQVRFLVIRYQCKDPLDAMPLTTSTLRGYPLVVADSSADNFTRSSNINQLSRLVRPEARFLVVDVDMLMTEEVLKNVVKHVSPGVAYFPIVWSKYSPKLVARVSKEMGRSIFTYSGWEGAWRGYGYGMFALHAQDLARFPMNESFVGWGGEDNEFYDRVKRDPSMSVVRDRERGLVHLWHDKNCSRVVENPQKRFACLGSKAQYLG